MMILYQIFIIRGLNMWKWKEGNVAIPGEGTTAGAEAQVGQNISFILKTHAPFMNYLTRVNASQIDNARDPDAVMLFEYVYDVVI